MKKIFLACLMVSSHHIYSVSAQKAETAKPDSKTHKTLVDAAGKHAVTTAANIIKDNAPTITEVAKNIHQSATMIQKNTGITTTNLKQYAQMTQDLGKTIYHHIQNNLSLKPTVQPYVKNIGDNLQFAHQHLRDPFNQMKEAFMPLILMAQQEVMNEENYIKQVSIVLEHISKITGALAEELNKQTAMMPEGMGYNYRK